MPKKKHYTLHIEHEDKKPKEPKKKVQKYHKTLKQEPEEIKSESLADRIWGFLRFLSSAAIIFIVLFFVMNWNAYSTLILNKLGFFQTEQQEQEYTLPIRGSNDLMEVSKDPEVQKKQIPDLNIEVNPPDTRIVIPRIGKNVPVVTISSEALIKRDWALLEQQIQEALRDGVVHYPETAFPNEDGNMVVTGHSSYFAWDPGRFKDVFALLHDVQIGDKIYVYHDQDRYEYEVYETKVVLPTQVDILTQEGEDRLTLITCTPVGTNLKRLIVLARPV
jgi:LPXTG-site transpeptidase (sortase) family protein